MSFDQLQQALRGLHTVNRKEKQFERDLELNDARENVVNNNSLLISRLNDELTNQYSLVQQQFDLTTPQGLLDADDHIKAITSDKMDRLDQEYTSMRGMDRRDYHNARNGFKTRGIGLKDGLTKIATVKIQFAQSQRVMNGVEESINNTNAVINSEHPLPTSEIITSMDIGLNSAEVGFDGLGTPIQTGTTSDGDPIFTTPKEVPESLRDAARFSLVTHGMDTLLARGEILRAQEVLNYFTDPENKNVIRGHLNSPKSKEHGTPFLNIIRSDFVNKISTYGRNLDKHAKEINERIRILDAEFLLDPDNENNRKEKTELENKLILGYENLRKVISEGGEGLNFPLEDQDRANRGWVKSVLDRNNTISGSRSVSGQLADLPGIIEGVINVAGTPEGVDPNLIYSEAVRIWFANQTTNSVHPSAGLELVALLKDTNIPREQRVHLLSTMNQRRNMFQHHKRHSADNKYDELYQILDYNKYFGYDQPENVIEHLENLDSASEEDDNLKQSIRVMFPKDPFGKVTFGDDASIPPHILTNTYSEWFLQKTGSFDSNLVRILAQETNRINVLGSETYKGSLELAFNRFTTTHSENRIIANWTGHNLGTPEGEQALNQQIAAALTEFGIIPIDASNDEIHDLVMKYNVEAIDGDDGGYTIYNTGNGSYLKQRGIPVRMVFNPEFTSPEMINFRLYEEVNSVEERILASSSYRGKDPTLLDMAADTFNYLFPNPLIPTPFVSKMDIPTQLEIVTGGSPIVDPKADIVIPGTVGNWIHEVGAFLGEHEGRYGDFSFQQLADLITPGRARPDFKAILNPELPAMLASITDHPVAQRMASELYALHDEVRQYSHGVMPPSISSYLGQEYGRILRNVYVYAFADELKGEGSLSLDQSPWTIKRLDELTLHMDQDIFNRFVSELGPEAGTALMDKLRLRADKVINPLLKLTHYHEFKKLLNNQMTIEEVQNYLDEEEYVYNRPIDVEVPSTEGKTRNQIRSGLQIELEKEATRSRDNAEIIFGTDFTPENIKEVLDQIEIGQEKWITDASAITSPEGTMELIAVLDEETIKGNKFNVSVEKDSGNGRTVRIARVTDGDTVLTQDGERIRFLGVDTPETAKKFKNQHAQPYANEAMALTIALLDGKTANIELSTDRKSYGRTLASLSAGGVSADKALVGHGLARVLVLNGLGTEYGREEIQRLYELERSAKRRRVGIHSPSSIEVEHTNKDFFIGRHSRVAGSMIDKNKNLTEFSDFVTDNKEIKTLYISIANNVSGYPGQIFLVPRFNDDTGQDESIEIATNRVLKHIESGELLPYKNIETAEAHRIKLNEALTKEKFTIIEHFTKHAPHAVSKTKIENLRRRTTHWDNDQLWNAFESFYQNNAFAFPTYKELDMYRMKEEVLPNLGNTPYTDFIDPHGNSTKFVDPHK